MSKGWECTLTLGYRGGGTHILHNIYTAMWGQISHISGHVFVLENAVGINMKLLGGDLIVSSAAHPQCRFHNKA